MTKRVEFTFIAEHTEARNYENFYAWYVALLCLVFFFIIICFCFFFEKKNRWQTFCLSSNYKIKEKWCKEKKINNI